MPHSLSMLCESASPEKAYCWFLNGLPGTDIWLPDCQVAQWLLKQLQVSELVSSESRGTFFLNVVGKCANGLLCGCRIWHVCLSQNLPGVEQKVFSITYCLNISGLREVCIQMQPIPIRRAINTRMVRATGSEPEERRGRLCCSSVISHISHRLGGGWIQAS